MDSNNVPRKFKLKLNLFDIIFIACALVAAAFIFLYSGRSDSGMPIVISGSNEQVVFTIELQGMLDGTAELIKPGDTLFDRVERRAVGTVVSADIRPARTSQKNWLTGDRDIVGLPQRTDAVVVVTAQANVTDSQINVNGLIVRVGTRVTVNGPLYSGVGFVISIERNDLA